MRKRKVHRLKRDYHVVFTDDGPRGKHWGVIREGGSRHKRFHTQAFACIYARNMAIRYKVEVVIHRRDGSIRDSDTYGLEGKRRDRKH